MNPSFQHTHTRSSAIHSWENEGGALAQESVTAPVVDLPSEGRQMLIAIDHFRTPNFRRAPDENALALRHVGIKTRVSRNETIFNEGDRAEYAYKLVSGAVRLCKHMADGRRQIAEFLLPGDFFGFLQLGFYSFTAEAISDVGMICYTQRQVEQISNSTPESRARLLVLLSQRLVGMQDHLMMLGRQNAKERIAHFLLLLADRLHTEEDTPLALPMRRRDIADYLGLRIETVSRVLSDLKRAGTIGIPRLNQVVLKDIESLRTIAEGDDEIYGS
jgi:CRP-like cAMP-binding protein